MQNILQTKVITELVVSTLTNIKGCILAHTKRILTEIQNLFAIVLKKKPIIVRGIFNMEALIYALLFVVGMGIGLTILHIIFIGYPVDKVRD